MKTLFVKNWVLDQKNIANNTCGYEVVRETEKAVLLSGYNYATEQDVEFWAPKSQIITAEEFAQETAVELEIMAIVYGAGESAYKVYLKDLCETNGIKFRKNAATASLKKLLNDNSVEFQTMREFAEQRVESAVEVAEVNESSEETVEESGKIDFETAEIEICIVDGNKTVINTTTKYNLLEEFQEYLYKVTENYLDPNEQEEYIDKMIQDVSAEFNNIKEEMEQLDVAALPEGSSITGNRTLYDARVVSITIWG